jgi:ATP-binding cassette subfamily B protein
MFERRAIAIKQHAGEQLALLQESLQMMRLVRGYQMEIFNQARVERQLLTCGNASRDHYQGQALYRSAMLLFGVVVVAILTSVAGWKIMNHQLGLGASVTIILTIVSLYAPTLGAIRSRRTVQRAEESASMLFGFLDRRADVGQVVGAKLLPPMSRLLEFDGVVLREPGGSKFLLDHISLTIRAGDKVAFVGQDEREKQAIISLIPRFLDPEEGELRIDGNKLKLVTLESLRMQVAVVLQQNLIFNDTVANNIRCGDTAQALPRIIEAAKVAHAHQFIQKLPKGYDTRIGDLGFNCSPIQRFQIALARAVLRDPAILVIEEPTGGVDDDYRALLEDTYRRFLPGRTVIFLPHIMSTLRLADCIFLFQKGKIEVAGSHRDLLKTNELYRHLQYLEFNDFQDQGA